MFWREGIDPRHEPHKVLIHKGEFVDPARDDRAVPYKIYYPAEEAIGRVPVVLWSHGLGGSREGAAFLTRWIASQGYVVVNVQHPGTDSSLWEGKEGHPWDVMRKTHIPRSASLNRFRDIPFVLDSLPGLAAEKPALGRHMDLEALGMSGHSFGAMTAQVMAGMVFPDENDVLSSLREDRFRAGILYSFVPMNHLSDKAPEDIYGPMRIPLFFMTGNADDNPLTGQDYTHRMPVYEYAGCPEKHIMILDDGDHMVYAGSRGKLGDNPLREMHEDIIKVTSLAFWDAHLKGDGNAKAWLTGAGISTYLEGLGHYEYHKP